MKQWQRVMTQEEFQQWIHFYREQPFDDFHRFHRPAALVSVSMNGGDIKNALEFLQPEPIPEGLSAADMRSIKALGGMPRKR